MTLFSDRCEVCSIVLTTTIQHRRDTAACQRARSRLLFGLNSVVCNYVDHPTGLLSHAPPICKLIKVWQRDKQKVKSAKNVTLYLYSCLCIMINTSDAHPRSKSRA